MPARLPELSQAALNTAADGGQIARRARVETGAASDPVAEALPLRIDAAILLDQALRLKRLLVKRKAGLRVVRRIKDFTRTSLGRPAKRRNPDEDVKRYAAVLLKSGLFDPEYYLSRNPDVAAAGADPVMHYLQYGASELRNPSPYFSTRWYLRRYPDIAASGKNPLHHFIVSGYREGRLPLPKNPSDLFATDPAPDRSLEPLVLGTVVKQPPTTAADKGQSAATAATSNARLVVYTSMFGNYDDLFVPSPEQAQGCDFVVFTDQPDIPPPWRRGSIEYAAPCRARRSRFYKLLPHRLFPQHEWSLYLDANVDLRMNAIEFFDRYRDLGPDFFVFRHPSRTNILEELGACIGMKKDDAGVMVRQVAQYLESGFSQTFRLTENNVLLRRHNDPDLADLSEAWWDEVRSRSRRDQLSLSYVVERKNYRKIALLEQGRVTARNCPGFRVRPHRDRFHTHELLDHVLP